LFIYNLEASILNDREAHDFHSTSKRFVRVTHYNIIGVSYRK